MKRPDIYIGDCSLLSCRKFDFLAVEDRLPGTIFYEKKDVKKLIQYKQIVR